MFQFGSLPVSIYTKRLPSKKQKVAFALRLLALHTLCCTHRYHPILSNDNMKEECATY